VVPTTRPRQAVALRGYREALGSCIGPPGSAYVVCAQSAAVIEARRDDLTNAELAPTRRLPLTRRPEHLATYIRDRRSPGSETSTEVLVRKTGCTWSAARYDKIVAPSRRTRR
jgi:hypothetical protein